MEIKSFSTYDDYFNDWYDSFLKLVKTPGYHRNTITIKKWRDGFYENKVRNIHQRVRRLFKMKTGITRYKAFLLFGKKEGLRRWDEYCKKQVETKNQKNWNMSKGELEKYNKRRASTLENFIERHGEEKGKQKWNEYIARQKYTKSLDYYIEKYGPKEGPLKWSKTNKMKAITLENMVARYGKEAGEKKYADYINNKRADFYSREASRFFEKLEKELGKEMRYRPKNKELTLVSPDGIFCYDCLLAPDIIIEYNGSCFHGNPRIYGENECPNPFINDLTAKQIWEYDKKKIFAAVKENYRIIVVWDTAAKRETIFKEIKDIIEKDLIAEELF